MSGNKKPSGFEFQKRAAKKQLEEKAIKKSPKPKLVGQGKKLWGCSRLNAQGAVDVKIEPGD